MKIHNIQHQVELMVGKILSTLRSMELSESDFIPYFIHYADGSTHRYMNSIAFPILTFMDTKIKLVSVDSEGEQSHMVVTLDGEPNPNYNGRTLVLSCMSTKYSESIVDKIISYFDKISEDEDYLSILIHEMVHILDNSEDKVDSNDAPTLKEYIRVPQELDAVAAEFAYAVDRSSMSSTTLLDLLSDRDFIEEYTIYSPEEVFDVMRDRFLRQKFLKKVSSYL